MEKVHDLDEEREQRAVEFIEELHGWIDQEADGWDHVLLIGVSGSDVSLSAPDDMSPLEILGALEKVKIHLALEEEDA